MKAPPPVVCDKKVSQMSSSALWQQLVRESPDFSSVSIEREETRLGRVYIIGVSVALSCCHYSVLVTTWQYVIPPSISIRTLGWLRLLPSLVGLLFTFVGHKHVFLLEPFQDFCQFHRPFQGGSLLWLRVTKMKLQYFFRSILLLKWRTVVEKADVTTSRMPRATDLLWCGHW